MSAQTLSGKPEETLAREYAELIIARTIADMGVSVRLTELSEHCAETKLDATLVRVLMATNPSKFVYAERRWATAARNISASTTFNQAVVSILRIFGSPITLKECGMQLEAVYGRPGEVMEEKLQRFASASPDFFVSSTGWVGLREWLFEAADEPNDDALFINGLSQKAVDAYKSFAEDLDWNNYDAAAEMLKRSKKPVPSNVIGYFAWRALNPADPKLPMHYKSVKVFDAIMASNEYILMSDGNWYKRAETDKWLKKAKDIAEALAPTVEEEEAAPLEITAADLEQIVQIVLSKEKSVSARELLEEVFEVSTNSATFAEDQQMLINVLRLEDRIAWLGGNRFQTPDMQPPYVMSIPEILFMAPQNEAFEGKDIELIDEGFSSSLRRELSNPLSQDVLDEEPNLSEAGFSEQSHTFVVKAHHNEIGTMPLCQAPYGFLPTEPDLVEIVLRDTNGRELNVWINNQTRLMYGLFEWYLEHEVESGAVFKLQRTDDISIYEFQWEADNDPLWYINSKRLEELRSMQMRSEDLTVFDIIVEIMTKHPKGADYQTILAEVNVVRRVPRRLVASILSGYHCFSQKSGSPLWHFDSKKVKQGFDKAKRKFIKKANVLDEMQFDESDEEKE